MISVTTNLRAQVLLVPIIKQKVVVVLLFASTPCIERFIHYHDAHAVTEFEQFRRWRIMAGTDRVYTHLLENLDLSFQCANIERRAERTKIVMITYALQIDVFAV